jgi:Fanconi anemia group J protein
MATGTTAQSRLYSSATDTRSWYALQAYRAVNQAIGRCIRHVSDYGAIVLLDERYARNECASKLSKWIRGCLKSYTTVESSLVSLQEFFRANHATDQSEQ